LDLLYTDEDTCLNNVRENPFFKPDLSHDLLAGMNYIGRAFVIKKSRYLGCGEMGNGSLPAELHGLLLRAVDNGSSVGHIPSALFTKGARSSVTGDEGKRVIQEAMARQGTDAEVIALSCSGSYRVKRTISGSPKVSIIMPTGYKNPDANIIPCLRSIIEKSSYKNIELLLIDNSHGKFARDVVTGMLAGKLSYRIIDYPRRYNHSEINNIGAREAQGEYVILLNDDTEIISPDWIESMLEYAQLDEVGIVGCKLLYQDETVQHGGVFYVDHGGGGRHAFRFYRGDSDGYHGLLGVARNCSAVTFACVMVSKQKFFEIGGLDEELRVEGNDIDFCLRLGEAGYRVVWTPFAELYHKEVATRTEIVVPEDIELFWKKWRHRLEKGDPFYNPNLSLDSDSYVQSVRPVLVEHHAPNFAGSNLSTSGGRTSPALQSRTVSSDIRKILVVKVDHIGDVILSIPAIRLLKKNFPQASITALAGSWAKPVLELVPEVDRIVTFDFFNERSEEGVRKSMQKELDQLAVSLKQEKFDIAIDLRRHDHSRELLKLSGARYTAGYTNGEGNDWLSVGLGESPEVADIPRQLSKVHVTEQLCELVNRVSGRELHAAADNPEELYHLDVSDRNGDVKLPAGLNGADLLVGIHPGTGSTIRQWPVGHFASLADLLVERKNAKILIFGGKDEIKLASQLKQLMKHKQAAFSLAGEVNLNGFMNTLRHCSLFIGNVTGTSHIAGALGIPTLTVFAGQVLPHEWAPLGSKTLTVRTDVPCSPCYKSVPEECPFDLKCLKFLWPEKVYEAVDQLLIMVS
jgi:ADP-heptose:LPS heptosyltransferase/GT2 family glycosyltransferase